MGDLILVNEADVESIRLKAIAQADRGVEPRPIRKRGYHRALKRGASWAIMQKMQRDMLNEIAKQMYG